MKPSTIVIASDAKPLRLKQSGFSLLEISLAIGLAAMVSIGYLYNQAQDNQVNNAKVQAGYFLTVNDAVGKYMLTFYDDLKVIPPDCSQVKLTAGGVPSAITATTTCTFISGSASSPSRTPANALQPTVDDLKRLSMLDSSFQDRFMWTTLNTVNAPKADGCSPNCNTGTNTAPTRFVNRIQLVCDNTVQTGATKASCNSGLQLKSLTFNSQPFAPTDTGSFFKLSRHDMLSTAINTMGGDGMMSFERVLDSEKQGKLYGVGRQTSEANPIAYINFSDSTDTSNNTGVTGIMAVKNAAEVRCNAN